MFRRRTEEKPLGRPEEKLSQVFSNLFATRFLDQAKCKQCAQTAYGIFGPKEHESFYCRSCWFEYLRGVNEAEWATWEQWSAPREVKCLSDDVRAHELKCALLCLARIGGSLIFPSTLTSYDRQLVHSFCECEPGVSTCVASKSYGKSGGRFLVASSPDAVQSLQSQARAILLPENADDLSVTHLENLQKELGLAMNAVAEALAKKHALGNATNVPDKKEAVEALKEDIAHTLPRATEDGLAAPCVPVAMPAQKVGSSLQERNEKEASEEILQHQTPTDQKTSRTAADKNAAEEVGKQEAQDEEKEDFPSLSAASSKSKAKKKAQTGKR
mmetsp:Transcript_24534/g.39343  ORF Transcript_24534/g.39343 Transcript_24534/m.39343 type:complete len:329 (+) Transcript_24534:81-1067(+)